MRIARFLIILLVGAAVGAGAVFVFLESKVRSAEDAQISAKPVREGGEQFQFINPLLFCDVSEEKEYDGFRPIKIAAQKFLENETRGKDIQTVSVYYRALNSGRWFGINENANFSPASLLKIPTLIAYLKKARGNSQFLQTRLRFSGAVNENARQAFLPKEELQKGREYTIEELLRAMIVFSDNNAYNLLLNAMPADDLVRVYQSLGIPLPRTPADDQFMSTKMFSYAFRVLYNASYLGRNLSERALKLLTETQFDGGIRASIPSDVTVAHKYGERTFVDSKNAAEIRELHDCGIVYDASDPYLLCVMTRGKYLDYLSQTIKGVSSLIFDARHAKP